MLLEHLILMNSYIHLFDCAGSDKSYGLKWTSMVQSERLDACLLLTLHLCVHVYTILYTVYVLLFLHHHKSLH